MQLEKLKSLHREMRKLDISVDVFEYEYNHVKCSVIFDTSQNRYTVTFIKKIDAKILTVPIIPSYDFQLFGKKRFEFINFFKIGNKSKSKFDIKDFYNHFNNKIPLLPKKLSRPSREILMKQFTCEHPECVYYDHLINWDKINKLNRNKPGYTPHHRRPRNLEKTMLLYPEIYSSVKNFDISIVYSQHERTNESQLIKKHIEVEL